MTLMARHCSTTKGKELVNVGSWDQALEASSVRRELLARAALQKFLLTFLYTCLMSSSEQA